MGRYGSEVTLSAPEAVEPVLRSLRRTSPYSPNHEDARQTWLVILLTDGTSREVRVGDGNLAHPQAVWIQFGVEV